MDNSPDISLINFIYFPALVIDNKGTVISRSKKIKLDYQIAEGECLYDYCNSSDNTLANFIENFVNLPIGSQDKCLTQFEFLHSQIDVYISILSKKPALFLIEFIDEPKQTFVPPISDIATETATQVLADNSSNLLSLVDHKFKYVTVNQKYVDTWGIKKDEIEGSHVAEILGEETFQTIVKNELERSFLGEIRRYSDWFYSDKHKQMMYMRVVYQPVFTEGSNKVNSVAVTVTDITDVAKTTNNHLTWQKESN